MICDNVQRRLLEAERPQSPPADLRDHLSGCAACRAWHEQFVALEAEVPFLPVPPPLRRTSFLRSLRDRHPLATRLYRPTLDSQRERGQRKLALAVALAASLLVVALGAWLWTPAVPDHKIVAAQRTALEQRLDSEPTWAEARTARERVNVLAVLARDVEDRALLRSASRDEVRKQVQLYSELIERLTDQEAQRLEEELPLAADRKLVLQPIVVRLEEVESLARRLAMERRGVADSLHELARVAEKGSVLLRSLYAA